MLELLWQMGILSAILVFGVKIGLASGFAGLSKKAAVAVSAGYGLGIFVSICPMNTKDPRTNAGEEIETFVL